jgi:ATP-dependent DNA helicase RecG
MIRRSAPFSESEIRALLEREEGQFLEFKSLWNRREPRPTVLKRRLVRDTIAEYVAAFANADGGVLLLGVDDDGIPSGHRYPEEAIEDFFRVPETRLRPPTPCRTGRVHVGDKEILIFDIAPAQQAVMVDGDGFPYRVGDKVLTEPQEVINARKEAYRRVGYEQRIRAEATLGDLDLERAQGFLSSGIFSGRTVEEALERYGLIHKSGEGWRVTNAALLLFSKDSLARWHPRAGIRFFRVEGTGRRHGKSRNVTRLESIMEPLAMAVEEAYRSARAQIRRSETLHNLFFKETPEYPEFAWQEAIVNAIAHRDYEIQSREIEVWFYEDRMEIHSPGELVPPVTLDALKNRQQTHASRNPLIVRLLADVGIMRDEGEGVPRIFEEMEGSFLQPPDLRLEDGVFKVVLFNEPTFTGPTPVWRSLVEELPIEVGLKRVLLAHPEGFTNEDYRRLNRVDRDEAYREIQELVRLGVVSRAESAGRGAVYRVSENLRETEVFFESRLPRLREFFTTHRSLKNADYREMFEVTRQQALKELRQLVEERCLRLEGERRGARYFPERLLKENQL